MPQFALTLQKPWCLFRKSNATNDSYKRSFAVPELILPSSLNHIWHKPLFYKLPMLVRMFQNNIVHLNFYVKPLVSIIGASWTRNSAALNILILWYISKTNPLLSQFLNTYSNFAHTLFYRRPNSTSLKIATHPFFFQITFIKSETTVLYTFVQPAKTILCAILCGEELDVFLIAVIMVCFKV